MGINNIELISDRPTDVNIAEIREVKKRYPNNAVVISLMVEAKREAWNEILAKCNDTGADGYELNFGCPHGMSERGMGAAVGQVPEYVQMITEWVMEKAELPVLVKLTPNITDIRYPARAARAANADGVALINTISSLIGVNLDTWSVWPDVRGKGSHGGYAGPAVKPIALNMVSQVASDPEVGIPVSGIGGIETWRDAVDFMLLGASTVQVGTSVMHYGFRLIDDLVDGLSTYLKAKGLHSPADLVGKALPTITDWGHLDQEFRLLAHIDEAKCIRCNLCYAACNDGAHQAIRVEDAGGARRLDRRGRLLRGLPPVPVRLPGGGLHHVRGAGGRGRHPLSLNTGARSLGPRARGLRARARIRLIPGAASASFGSARPRTREPSDRASGHADRLLHHPRLDGNVGQPLERRLREGRAIDGRHRRRVGLRTCRARTRPGAAAGSADPGDRTGPRPGAAPSPPR